MPAARTRFCADRIYELGTENAFKIGPHIALLEAAGHRVVRLNLGEPDFDIPPFVRDEVKAQLDRGNTHYCDPKGILPLRKAIAAQTKEVRGLDVSPEQVVVFPGVPANDLGVRRSGGREGLRPGPLPDQHCRKRAP